MNEKKTLSAVPPIAEPTDTSVVLNVYQRLSAIMDEVGVVGKEGFNPQQKFNFRGVDAVVNAVSPALRKHGVIVIPEVLEEFHEQVAIGSNRTMMLWVRLKVKYTFISTSDGQWVSATVPSEAMDSGDKATAKAMSVAFRTALLQVLALPTDEPDPDSQTYDRSVEIKDENGNALPFIPADKFEEIKTAMTFASTVDILVQITNQLQKYNLDEAKHEEAVALFNKQKTAIEQNASSEGKTKDVNADVTSELPPMDGATFEHLKSLFDNAPTMEVLADGIELAKKYIMEEPVRTQLLAIHNARKAVLKAEGGK